MTPDTGQRDALVDLTIGRFLQSLGDKVPTPGGGAVASIIAALGAALGRMVVNYSLGKKKFAEHAVLHEECLSRLEEQTHQALQLAEADAAAYDRLGKLMKLDRDDPIRRAEFASAVDGAIAAPRHVLDLCMEMMELLERLSGTTNRMLASDLAIAAILAEAGAKAAAWNIHINLPLLEDETKERDIRDQCESSLTRAESLRRRIETACREEA